MWLCEREGVRQKGLILFHVNACPSIRKRCKPRVARVIDFKMTDATKSSRGRLSQEDKSVIHQHHTLRVATNC